LHCYNRQTKDIGRGGALLICFKKIKGKRKKELVQKEMQQTKKKDEAAFSLYPKLASCSGVFPWRLLLSLHGSCWSVTLDGSQLNKKNKVSF